MNASVGRVVGLAGCLALLVAPVVRAQSGSVAVGADVPPPAPAIHHPLHGATLQNSRIEVSISCQAGLIIKLSRNAVIVGMSVCLPNGRVALPIDLLAGTNELVARQYDQSGQQLSDAAMIVVVYAPSPNRTGSDMPTALSGSAQSPSDLLGVSPSNINNGPPPTDSSASAIGPDQRTQQSLPLIALLILILLLGAAWQWRRRRGNKHKP